MRSARASTRVQIDPRRFAELDHDALGDAVLVRRARDGEPAALDALVRRHQGRVHELAAHLLRDPEDARDAAQEALAKLCTRIDQYRGEARFTTWLHRLVANTCHDLAQRQARRRHESLDRYDVAAQTDVEADAASASLRPLLRRRLAALPPAQRRAVVLKDVLSLPYEAIAADLGLPDGTVKCQAHRARKALRVQLERAGEGRRAS